MKDGFMKRRESFLCFICWNSCQALLDLNAIWTYFPPTVGLINLRKWEKSTLEKRETPKGESVRKMIKSHIHNMSSMK